MNLHPYFKAWTPDIVIYHDPCTDGFAAAYAAWVRWNDACVYFPTTYGAPPPDVTGLNVLIVDFSYKKAVIGEMAKSAKQIVILDHHKTAQSDLAAYPTPLDDYDEFYAVKVFALFDMAKSGARLAWEFCHPNTPVPELIILVEDRDLWKFDYPDSRPFLLWLNSQTQDFRHWLEISVQMAGIERRAIMAEARAIERYYDQRIAQIVKEARLEYHFGIEVPTVNCNHAFAADVGHALLKAYPGAAFSVTYYDTKTGDRKYSLRSEDSRADVQALAKMHPGGGGHRNAAGFTTPGKYA